MGVATGTFGVLLRQAWMALRASSSLLGAAEVKQQGSGQERAGRAGGQVGGRAEPSGQLLEMTPALAHSLGHWCPQHGVPEARA